MTLGTINIQAPLIIHCFSGDMSRDPVALGITFAHFAVLSIGREFKVLYFLHPNDVLTTAVHVFLSEMELSH